jgi:hypothetical protein
VGALEDENEFTDDADELASDDTLLARLDDWPARELLWCALEDCSALDDCGELEVCNELEVCSELDDERITIALLALRLLADSELTAPDDDEEGVDEEGVDTAREEDCEMTDAELRELFPSSPSPPLPPPQADNIRETPSIEHK